MTPTTLLLPLAVCPQLPPGAQAAFDTINGYVLGGVIALFITVVIIGIGAIVLGRVIHNPHLTKGGVITLVVTVAVAALLPVLLPIVQGLIGTGCIG